MGDAYIVGAVRTAGGRRNGKLKDIHPIDLGAKVLDELVARTGVDPAAIEDVIFGCVDQVGAQAANIARNAVLSSSLPESVPGTTVDRQCGSSQQAIHFASQAVMSGVHDIVIAGGVELMSLVPLGGNAIAGHKAGMGGPYGEGMKQRYPGVRFNQFAGAEMMAEKWGFDRESLDRFGLSSHQKAARATNEGRFEREILPIEAPVVGPDGAKTGETKLVKEDQGIRPSTLEGLQALKPVMPGNIHTAGTSSQISDGAAGLLWMTKEKAKALGLRPRARIIQDVVVGTDPYFLLDGPVDATNAILAKTGMKLSDIDLVEINEAFAAVVLSWAQVHDADMERVNVNGGAIALGHPVGATGSRLIVTALHELERRDASTALITMCCGSSVGTGTIIERL